jgi:hypothetical protein
MASEFGQKSKPEPGKQCGMVQPHSMQCEWPHGGEEFVPDIQQAQLGAKPAEDGREWPHKGKGPHIKCPAAGKDSQLHRVKAMQG